MSRVVKKPEIRKDELLDAAEKLFMKKAMKIYQLKTFTPSLQGVERVISRGTPHVRNDQEKERIEVRLETFYFIAVYSDSRTSFGSKISGKTLFFDP